MGCACNQRGKIQYEVAMDAGRGRVAFTSGSKPTATTVAQRYAGSAVRVKGTGEIIHHTETYEVTQSAKGPVLFVSSDLSAAKAEAATRETGYVRERETGRSSTPTRRCWAGWTPCRRRRPPRPGPRPRAEGEQAPACRPADRPGRPPSARGSAAPQHAPQRPRSVTPAGTV